MSKTTETNNVENIDLSSLAKIKEAMSLVIEKKLDLNQENKTELLAAVEAAGISDDHKYRIVISETDSVQGIPFLKKEDADDSEQIDVTFTELEDLILSSGRSLVEKDSEITALKENITSLESKITDLESVDAMKELASVKSDFDSYKKEYKDMLVGVVATEMKRCQYPVAMENSMEELLELLSKRTNESLIDTYTDLVSITKTSPSTTKVENPVLSNEKNSLKKFKDILSSGSTEKTKEEAPSDVDLAVKEDDAEKLKIDVNKDGTVSVRVVEKEIEDPSLEAHILRFE